MFFMVKHIILCVSGFSGTGKDEFVKSVVEKHNAVQIDLADPAKRHVAEIYGWTEEQLFGPSKMRNKGDIKYPKHGIYSRCDNDPTKFKFSVKRIRENFDLIYRVEQQMSYFKEKRFSSVDYDTFSVEFQEGDPAFFLSPREALQIYCEKMNELYPDTWVDLCVKTHKKLASSAVEILSDMPSYYMRMRYSKMGGLTMNKPEEMTDFGKDGHFITCLSGFRHVNESTAFDRSNDTFSKFVKIRIKRPGIESPPFNHRSETEQLQMLDSSFDYVVNNSGTIEDLHEEANRIVKEIKGKTK